MRQRIAAMLLNRSGHDVVGTDISALFLEEAAQWQKTTTRDGEHNLNIESVMCSNFRFRMRRLMSCVQTN